MDVYVITVLGTPVSVQFSMMDAERMVDDWIKSSGSIHNTREDFRIFSVPIEPLWQWIVNAMKRANVVNAERGTAPVVVPVSSEAFLFAVSEVGEAADAFVSELNTWLRNHPDKHKDSNFEWEVSQAIMMLALSTKADFFEDIKKQLSNWGFIDDPYTEPLE